MERDTTTERDRAEPVLTLGEEMQPAEQQRPQTQFTSKGATLPGVSTGESPRATTASDLAFKGEGAESLALATKTESSVEPNGETSNLGAAAGGGKLPPAEREKLEEVAQYNLLQAYTAYSNAVHNHRAKLKGAADDSNEFVLALIEVGLGIALPGAGRLGGVVLNRLANAPRAAALVQSVVSAPEFGGIVTGLTKAATMSVKGSLPASKQYSTEDQFLNALLQSFGDARAEMSGQIPGMSDVQVAAVTARFDRSVANEANYGTIVDRMVKTMELIQGSFKRDHKRWGGGARAEMERYSWWEENKILQIGDAPSESNRLAVVQEKRGGDPSNRRDGFRLVQWIPDEMKQSAIAHVNKLGGHYPHWLHTSDLLQR